MYSNAMGTAFNTDISNSVNSEINNIISEEDLKNLIESAVYELKLEQNKYSKQILKQIS